MIKSIPLDRPLGLDAGTINSGRKNENTSQMTKFASSQEQKSDITIYTSEGDKVTLSSGAQSQLNYTNYENLAKTKGNISRSQSQSLELSSSQSYSISVEGNLSEDELKDIDKALKTIDKVMTDFLSGDIDQVANDAQKISGLDSIASLEAITSFKKQTSLEQQVTTQTQLNPPPLSDEARDISEPSLNPDEILMGNAEKLMDKMTSGFEDSNIKDSDRLKNSIKELFKDLFKKFNNQGMDENPDKIQKLKTSEIVQDKLLEKINKLFGFDEVAKTSLEDN